MKTIKRIILCFVLNFVLILSSAFAAPRLIVPPEGVAFGEISAGEAAEKVIELRNVSSSPVLISQVKGCCGADAALSTMRLEPTSGATLTVSLKPTIPGEFSKHVRILCDDPECPVVVIPVTGAAVETPSVNSTSRWTFLTVLIAGLADGFNPCAFSIIIVLAGILAVGGRKRRARLLGGWAFCIASFFTYMAMGLGLMRVIRALEDLRIIHDVIMVLLSISLFVLAILSVRDAFRYRKEKVPSAITLQLPDKVKRLIRVVAETSWSGPAVVVTGFGCGFLVTLLDSLCTGQIYVPVLALISREVEAWRSFILLVVYNLAFIAPLIVIFILAAKGADSERMSRWSKRNVFPSKIAMGFVFAILGMLVLPKFGGFLVDAFIK
jgi:cytochrome c biogenesis protein CcdA